MKRDASTDVEAPTTVSAKQVGGTDEIVVLQNYQRTDIARWKHQHRLGAGARLVGMADGSTRAGHIIDAKVSLSLEVYLTSGDPKSDK